MFINPRGWFGKIIPSHTPTQYTDISTNKDTSSQHNTRLNPARLGFLLAVFFPLFGAISTARDWEGVQRMERQTQAWFFKLRGPVAAPDNIVILGIDEESLNLNQSYYNDESQALTDLELIKSWPWKRAAYAKAIERVMAAGAKSVAVSIVLDSPSSYGEADDQRLREVLKNYGERVTLAAMYETYETVEGETIKLVKPNSLFETPQLSVGSINYPIEPDGRIYRLANQFPKVWAKNNPELAETSDQLMFTVPSFNEATLAKRPRYAKAAAQESGLKTKPKPENIFFYGSDAFTSIPFWYVLDDNRWHTRLDDGKSFQDKIVLIGPTASSLPDFHRTPVSDRMAGVEINANAIATLLEGHAIVQAIPNPIHRGVLIFLGVNVVRYLFSRIKRWQVCLGWTVLGVITWGGISYLFFVYEGLILPTAVPLVSMTLSGIFCSAMGAIQDLKNKQQLRQTLKHYVSAPIVQEIISGQDDLRNLLEEREQELLATKLSGRYQIIKRLSAGGFGETFIAEDTQRPGNPTCVVKQLKPASNNPQHWQLARRLFQTEAEILEKLGKHHQIPELLAYFDENQEFYLVEEFINGHPLSNELLPKPLPEANVIGIVVDILQALQFVHSHSVIHRDIKPDNLIRRKSDQKLVLIDFGAVKEITNQLHPRRNLTKFTVGIGTKGYMPNEQAVGSPRFNSDIYATGMIAVRSLTGIPPSKLPTDPITGEVIWLDKAQVSPELATVVNKMVRYSFRSRYQSAQEVLEALKPLTKTLPRFSFSSPESSVALQSQASTLPEPEETMVDSDFSSSQKTVPLSESTTVLEDSTMVDSDCSSSQKTVPLSESTTVLESDETLS
ncbi:MULTISPECIES: serine/threonine-protein kinase [unclassified Moorena]|uniref:serine/threonine-protein kinase n=1 Tax=unclassified Moorena TaxID=2683338 RepID=UPI0013CA036B|nr:MULTISPECIES: serine/threonine-protein kinase [unclassified Moorena]NEO23486.1 CHASE2 domain-containing protein [Moorena sp. SIO4A5]NEQ56021.1 CHASE2 domain-containing protein [Moorena sp. SIO4A1]